MEPRDASSGQGLVAFRWYLPNTAAVTNKTVVVRIVCKASNSGRNFLEVRLESSLMGSSVRHLRHTKDDNIKFPV